MVAPLRSILREEWMAQGRPKKGKVCPPRKRSASGMIALGNTLGDGMRAAIAEIKSGYREMIEGWQGQ